MLSQIIVRVTMDVGLDDLTAMERAKGQRSAEQKHSSRKQYLESPNGNSKKKKKYTATF